MVQRTYILTQRPPRRWSAVAVAVTAFSFPLWASLSRPLAMGDCSGGFVLIRDESAFISIMPLLG